MHGQRRDNARTAPKLSFHSLRQTAVSLLKDAGVPDAVVMALVGHESSGHEPPLYSRRQGSTCPCCPIASRNLKTERTMFARYTIMNRTEFTEKLTEMKQIVEQLLRQVERGVNGF